MSTKKSSSEFVAILQRLGWLAFKGKRRLERDEINLCDLRKKAQLYRVSQLFFLGPSGIPLPPEIVSEKIISDTDCEVIEDCQDLFEGVCRWLAERIGESLQAVREAFQTGDLHEERHTGVIKAVRALAEKGEHTELLAMILEEFSNVLATHSIEIPIVDEQVPQTVDDRRLGISQDVESGIVKSNKDVAHSIDFRSLKWYGETYSFTANQAPVVKALYENWENGTPDVGGETLLMKVDSEAPPARLSVLFYNHPAWKNLIVSGGSKGTYRFIEK